MTTTPEQIAHVLELDSKRTQGEWTHAKAPNTDPMRTDEYEIHWSKYGECVAEIVHGEESAAFIAAAPLMAQIIRHQQEQLRVARQALERYARVMDLIDLDSKRKEVKKAKAKKKKRDGVGYKCRYNDGKDDWFKFSVTHAFKGKSWSFDIWAKNKREAELRLFAIKRFPCEITQILDEVQM